MLVVEAHNTLEEIESLARKERSAKLALRLRAVALAMQELSCAQIGAVLGRAPDYALRWVRAYNKGGVDALRAKRHKGRARALTSEQESSLREFVQARAQNPTHARRVHGREVQEHVNAVMGVPMCLSAAYRTLHRLGLEPIKPRPRHEQNDPAKMKEWLENTAPLLSRRSGANNKTRSSSKSGTRTNRASAKRAR